jgi:hypothetical protein
LRRRTGLPEVQQAVKLPERFFFTAALWAAFEVAGDFRSLRRPAFPGQIPV